MAEKNACCFITGPMSDMSLLTALVSGPPYLFRIGHSNPLAWSKIVTMSIGHFCICTDLLRAQSSHHSGKLSRVVRLSLVYSKSYA